MNKEDAYKQFFSDFTEHYTKLKNKNTIYLELKKFLNDYSLKYTEELNRSNYYNWNNSWHNYEEFMGLKNLYDFVYCEKDNPIVQTQQKNIKELLYLNSFENFSQFKKYTKKFNLINKDENYIKIFSLFCTPLNEFYNQYITDNNKELNTINSQINFMKNLKINDSKENHEFLNFIYSNCSYLSSIKEESKNSIIYNFIPYLDRYGNFENVQEKFLKITKFLHEDYENNKLYEKSEQLKNCLKYLIINKKILYSYFINFAESIGIKDIDNYMPIETTISKFNTKDKLLINKINDFLYIQSDKIYNSHNYKENISHIIEKINSHYYLYHMNLHSKDDPFLSISNISNKYNMNILKDRDMIKLFFNSKEHSEFMETHLPVLNKIKILDNEYMDKESIKKLINVYFNNYYINEKINHNVDVKDKKNINKI